MPNNNLLLKFASIVLYSIIGGAWLMVKAGYLAFRDIRNTFDYKDTAKELQEWL